MTSTSTCSPLPRAESIEIGMTIPQIAGQEEFAPSVGVIAAGLDSSAVSELPEEVRTLVSAQTGATVLEPVEASFFFEPFSRTAYWRRQRQTVTFPVEGPVFVVVWHAASAVGRYTLVVGQREVPGGESGFGRKLKEYWTPVNPGPTSEGGSPVRADADATPTTADTEAVNESGPRCSWLMRLLAALMGASELCQCAAALAGAGCDGRLQILQGRPIPRDGWETLGLPTVGCTGNRGDSCLFRCRRAVAG